SARRFALWALAAAAALATHYFAGFLIGAEAVWMLWRTPARRRAAAAIAAVALVAGALLPLALHQRSTGAAAFISAGSLLRRSAAGALGPVGRPRAIIVTPASGRVPLLLSLRGAHSIPPQGVDVKELDYVGLAPRLPGQTPHPPRPPVLALPNFGEFARKEGQ